MGNFYFSLFTFFMKRLFSYITGLIILIGVLYSMYLVWQQSRPADTQYHIYEARRADIRCEVTLSGAIEPRKEVVLYPQVSGTIAHLWVKEGDEVHQGDLIATIAIQQHPGEIVSTHAEVSDAQIVLDQQKRETERARDLFKNGIITRQELEQQEYLLHRAEESMHQAQAAAQVAQRGYASGNSRVNEVRSSIDGRVLSLPVQEQMTVVGTSPASMGTPVAKIGQIDEMIFRGMVDESQVAAVMVGQSVRLKIAAIANQPMSAIVEAVSADAQRINGIKQYEVKATLVAEEGQMPALRSGFSAYAYVTTAEVKEVVTVPESVIADEADGFCVYELTAQDEDGEHQQFRRIPVTLGLSNGLNVEVTSGVEPGMWLRGTRFLK